MMPSRWPKHTPPQMTQLAGFGLDASQPARASETAAVRPKSGGCTKRGRNDRAERNGVAPAPLAAQHSEGRCDRRRVGGNDEPDDALVRRASAGARADCVLQRSSVVGQVNLMTIESFDRPGRNFRRARPRSVAFVSVNTQAAGGAWSMQGAMTQGDLSSWIVAGSYQVDPVGEPRLRAGMSYSTQRYDGGKRRALGAIRDSARNVGSVYGYDEWTVSPRLVLGYGTGYARYDYLGGPGVWSPRFSVTVPLDGFRVKALASRKALVPGAEEFAPSVTGMWLPPERTFSSLAYDGRFTPEQVRHCRYRSSAISRRASPCRCAASISASTIS